MNERTDARQRILDVAESLFAREGYDKTSLRAITGLAEVNLAAVTYYFGSKEALLEAVFERRLVPLNEVRGKRLNSVLDDARRAGHVPSVRDVLLAFIEPSLKFWESGPGARDFIALVGRSMADPNDKVFFVFLRFMGEILGLLQRALSEAAPHLSEPVLRWRFHLVMGVIAHTMHFYRRTPPEGLEHFEHLGLPPNQDAESIVRELITFLDAGIRA